MRPARTVLVVALLVVSSVAPVGAVAAAATQEAETYAGTHVEFETAGDAVVDYSVDGETVLESVTVQSQSAAESGARMEAHDNARGILVVRSGDDSQYVTVNVSSTSQTEDESDRRVAVTTEDGTEGVFLVVGDGTVTVNEQGNVSADVGSDGALVFRSYSDGRDDDDREQERLISEGRAAAEVYVMESGEDGSEFVADVVQYGEDTSVEVTQQTQGTVTMTAERSQEQGKIIITSVSEAAISAVENLQVTVDGEAAAEASSYGELETASDGGDTSKFLVRQRSSAQASADVLVAVNGFSTREITMSEGGSDDGQESTATSTESPGFGPVAALLALVALVGLVRRR